MRTTLSIFLGSRRLHYKPKRTEDDLYSEDGEEVVAKAEYDGDEDEPTYLPEDDDDSDFFNFFSRNSLFLGRAA